MAKFRGFSLSRETVYAIFLHNLSIYVRELSKGKSPLLTYFAISAKYISSLVAIATFQILGNQGNPKAKSQLDSEKLAKGSDLIFRHGKSLIKEEFNQNQPERKQKE